MEAIQLTEDKAILDYFLLIKRKRVFLISVCIISIILSLVYSFNATPIYQATAQLLVERKAPKALDTREIVNNDTQVDFYRTQYELLRDRSLAKQVIQKLQLENSEELIGKKTDSTSKAPKWWSDLITSFKDLFAKKTDSPSKGHISDPYSPLIDSFLDKLEIAPVLNSQLINISFEGYNPSRVQEIINTLADIYIKKSIDLRISVEKDAQDWLKAKTEEFQKKLGDKENKIQLLKKKSNVKDFETRRIIAEKKIDQLIKKETELNSQRSQLEGLISLLKEAKNSPSNMFDTLPESVKNDDLKTLRKDYLISKSEFINLSKQLGPKHPSLIAAKENFQIIEKRIPKELDNLIESKLIDLRGLLGQEKAIEVEIKKHKRFITKLDGNFSEYDAMQKDLERDDKLFAMLSNRLKEVNVSSEYDESNVRLVYPAEVPRFPTKPNKTQNLIFGLFGGLIFGFAVIFIGESANSKIKSIEDIQADFGCPILGVVGLFDPKKVPLPSLDTPDSMIAESFRVIAKKIMDSANKNSKKVFVTTSSTTDEGKTTVTINLAHALAQFGKRVIVVDADLRKPSIHKVMKMNLKPGLYQILFPNKSNGEQQKLKVKNYPTIVSAGTISKNPVEILNSPKFDHLINALKNHFDFILIDSPPILNISDASIITRVCDGIIFTLKSNAHEKGIIKRAFNQLFVNSAEVAKNGHRNNREETISSSNGNPVKLMGIILNQYDFKNDPYGYGEYYEEYTKDYFNNSNRPTNA